MKVDTMLLLKNIITEKITGLSFDKATSFL